MRKKQLYNKLLYDYPDRIFVSDRDPEEFKPWLNDLRKAMPLIIELGIGIGDFLLHQAKNFPEYFFLGIELKRDRIYQAFHKSHEAGLLNIAFLQSPIEKLPRYSLPQSEQLYLLFPDPWPKDRHHKRRLTSSSFLQMYRSLLVSHGDIVFKTDDPDLFEYSLNSFSQDKWTVIDQNADFQTLEEEQTAYEKRFRAEEKPIHFLKASPTS